jgi:nucleotide-binding universal stress UspA family protein
LAPTLIACIGPSTDTDPTLPVMARWAGTFGGPEPWFVEVLPPDGLRDVADDVRETSLVQRRAERLADLGVRSEWDVLHGRDLVEAVERFAEQIDEPVLVVESEHWTDPDHVHLHSVARRLAHRARQPVLVVPHVGHRQTASTHAGR